MAVQPSSTQLDSFSIISSIRYDPQIPTAVSDYAAEIYPDPKDSPYYLLRFHRDRLLSAATHFNWSEAIKFLQRDLSQFAQILDEAIPDRTKPWRLRIALDSHGDCTVDINPAAPCSPRSLFVPCAGFDLFPSQPTLWRLYLDTQPSSPSPFTTHKTTVRDEYTAARQRVGITSFQEPAEVLLFNSAGEIMEGSITTPYFRRRAQIDRERSGSDTDDLIWTTPPLSSGGNAGTTRRYALEQKFCLKRVIKTNELVEGEECWLSNGVRGFIRAVVVLRR